MQHILLVMTTDVHNNSNKLLYLHRINIRGTVFKIYYIRIITSVLCMSQTPLACKHVKIVMNLTANISQAHVQ